MIQGCISKYISKNGVVIESSSVSVTQNSRVFYDVLRIENSIPLFYEDHVERFFNSFTIAHLEKPFSEDYFQKNLLQFIETEKIVNGNIRCAYYISESPEFVIYEVAHSYPTQKMYADGVAVGVLHAERENPNIKQELQVRTIANNRIAETGVYDVLFVDNDGNVTEGSRTNLFCIKDSTIYTALATDVLCGITRKKVIELITKLSIPFVERKISKEELYQFDALFLTGTSPKILPISTIENRKCAMQNELLVRLMQAYDKEIFDYIENKKKN